MRYFIDVEFNGFGGPLISLALAAEDPGTAPSYEALPCDAPEPWVVSHVLPVANEKLCTARHTSRNY